MRTLGTEGFCSSALRRRIAPVLVSLALGAAGIAAPAVSYAQARPAGAAPASARELFKSGDKKFKAGDYSGALADFQAVDGLKPTPQAARFIGLCQDKLGHYPDAVTAYERFLSNVPPKLAAEAEEIKARVAAIKSMPGKVHIDTTPPLATVAVDGKTEARPTPLDLELAPGKHTLHVTAPDREAQDRDIDVAYGSTTDVNLQLAAASAAPVVAPPPPVAEGPSPAVPPPAAPQPPPPSQPRSLLPAYITGGLAIVSTGVGVVFGVLALNDKSNFNKDPTQSTANTGENHALICDVALGVAVTLGVTSAVLFLTSDDGAPAPPKSASAAKKKPSALTFSAAPVVTPHGGGAGAVLRF
jgi:hypothetical protein